MDTDWRSVVVGDKETKVFEALADPRWEWRTLRALTKAANATEGEVRAILGRYPLLVRHSTVPSQDGQELYTLQKRFFESQSPIQKVWTFLSGSSSSST